MPYLLLCFDTWKKLYRNRDHIIIFEYLPLKLPGISSCGLWIKVAKYISSGTSVLFTHLRKSAATSFLMTYSTNSLFRFTWTDHFTRCILWGSTNKKFQILNIHKNQKIAICKQCICIYQKKKRNKESIYFMLKYTIFNFRRAVKVFIPWELIPLAAIFVGQGCEIFT